MTIGVLIFGLFIILAGILLTSSHAFSAAAITVIMLVGIQEAITFHWLKPGKLGLINGYNPIDIVVCSLIFLAIALSVWLYVRERERFQTESKRTEEILLQQKAIIKKQSQRHIAELKQMQLEEMQYIYRFSELGQYGVNMLHDIANHLTTLEIEVEALTHEKSNKTMIGIQEVVKHLNCVINDSRNRLQGEVSEREFDLVDSITKTVEFVNNRATKENVEIQWSPSDTRWLYRGDQMSFYQVITLLLNNAIDASTDKSKKSPRQVAVTAEKTHSRYEIRIHDWGTGIPEKMQNEIFTPFRTTKKTGLGLGLYIAKCTIEAQFSGTIKLDTKSDHTEFVITFPIKNPAKLQ